MQAAGGEPEIPPLPLFVEREGLPLVITGPTKTNSPRTNPYQSFGDNIQPSSRHMNNAYIGQSFQENIPPLPLPFGSAGVEQFPNDPYVAGHRDPRMPPVLLPVGPTAQSFGPSVFMFKPRNSTIEQSLVRLGEVTTVDIGPHMAFKDLRTGDLVVRKEHTVDTLADLEEIEDHYKFRMSLSHPCLTPLLDYRTEEILKLPMPSYHIMGYYLYKKENLRHLKEIRIEQKLPFREREFSVIAGSLVIENH